MKTRQLFSLLFSLLFSFLLVAGSLALPAGAIVTPELAAETAITRATGQFEATIPANTLKTVGNSFILNSGDVVSYDCSYTPRDASVKFGYIAPDGYFYGLSGSNGRIDKSIRVSQSGTYTLVIWNESNIAVSVWGKAAILFHTYLGVCFENLLTVRSE